VVAVLFLSRPIEAVQGQPGFLKTILISIAAAGGLTFFLVTFIYYIQAVTMAGTAAGDSAGDILYDPICGFQGGLGALLVGVKQAIPDKDITMLSFFQFKTDDLPGVYLIAILIWGIITGSTLKLLPFALFGSYTAWFYLRFFAYRADSFLRGDLSPDFSFASFFPAAAQPVADQAANVCLNITKIDAIMAADAQNVKQTSALLLGRASPSKDTFEANRRR
jgi:membrane associated rhomboid family serine protease